MVASRGETTASLVYFDTTLDDEIDGFFFDVDRGGFTARNLDGQSRRKGAEATLDTRLGRVALGATYAYVDTTVEDVRELRRPRHLGHVDARVADHAADLGEPRRHGERRISRPRLFDLARDGRRTRELSPLAGFAGPRTLTPDGRCPSVQRTCSTRNYVTVYGYRSPGFTAMAKAVFNP